MMWSTLKKTIPFLFLITLSSNLFSQEWEYGLWAGISNYFGDLNTNASFEFIGPGTGMFVRYNFNPRFAYKTGLNFGKVAFDDASSQYAYQQARNLSFSSNIFEFTNQIEFNFFRYEKKKEQYSFTPYLLTGISVFYFNPTTVFNDVTYSLQPLQTEGKGYSRVNVGIPVGGGFKYSFNPFWAIGVEGGLRKIFTDYLDDVSTTYPGSLSDPLANALSDRSVEVVDPPIGQEGKQRGVEERNDMYLFIGITIAYSPIKVKCPKPYKIP